MKKYTLLAGSAIMALMVTNAMAASESVTATLSASIGILEPVTVEQSDGVLDFGIITTKGRNNGDVILKLNPDGSIDDSISNAQVLANPSTTAIQISGGQLSVMKDVGLSNLQTSVAAYQDILDQMDAGTLAEDYEYGRGFYEAELEFAQEAMNAFTTGVDNINGFSVSLSESTFDLTDQNNNEPCGTVSGLTPNFKLVGAEGQDKILELRYGATFTLDDDYTPPANYSSFGECSHDITVTFIATTI